MIPGSTDAEPDSGYSRLESQIHWYDSKSSHAQRLYKRVKIFEFIVSALVPISAVTMDGRVTALLGALVILLEGLQQLCQWHHNWITYRSTCEALRHEKYTYLGRAGSYEGLSNDEAKRTLIERVEGLVSTEHSKWLSRQEYKAVPSAKGGRTTRESDEG